MREGYDYSGAAPTPAAIKAAGRDFIGRYVTPGRSVSIGAAEVRTMRAAGIDVAGVWERTANRSLAGRAAGAADAAEACAYVASIGGPPDGGIPYMVADDFGAQARRMLRAGHDPRRLATAEPPPHVMKVSDLPAIGDYMRGVADTVGAGRRAAYGGLRTIRYLFDAGLIDFGWQTYAWSGAWQARPGDVVIGSTAWDPRAQLRQYLNAQMLGGVEVDYDRATVANFGQWNYQGGLHMDADVAAAFKAVNERIDGVFTLLSKGDDPEPAGGNTHPDNLRTVRRRLETLTSVVAGLTDDEAHTAAAIANAEAAAAARDAALTAAVEGVSASGGQVDLDALSQRMYDAADRAVAARLAKGGA